MIIKICGTSGSGKTWVMRQLIERFGPWLPQHVVGRKKPLWSISTAYNVAILADSEPVPDNYATIRHVIEASKPRVKGVPHILSEGLLESEDVRQARELSAARYAIRFFCLDSVMPPAVERSFLRLKNSKIPIFRKTREATVETICTWLGAA